MENFFIEDNFFMDLDSLITHLDLDEKGAIEALDEDWFKTVELSQEEPVHIFTVKDIENFIEQTVPEDRLTEYGDEYSLLSKLFLKNMDLEKINAEIPKYIYGSGQFEKITKQDLLEYIK